MKLGFRMSSKGLRTRCSLLIGLILGAITYLFATGGAAYRVEERYVFTAGPAGGEVFLAILQPVSGPYQRITNATVTSAVPWQEHGVPGNDFINVVAGSIVLLPGQTAEVNATYHATVRSGRTQWVEDYHPEHLLPENNIESDHPIIVAEATRLAGGTRPDTARRIYDFVAGYLSWPQGSRINIAPSALAAFESRVGGCAEFANLTTALSRAAGVPAVTISGLAMPRLLPFARESAVWNHPAGAHGWVELHTGSNWIMADPSWARPPRLGAHYGRNDGRHLSFGPDILEAEVYAQAVDWATTHGSPVAGMSAPNKFIATSSTPGVELMPHVTIVKGLDTQHVASILAFVLGTTLAWIGFGLLPAKRKSSRPV